MTKKLKLPLGILAVLAVFLAALLFLPGGATGGFAVTASAEAATITPTKPSGEGTSGSPYEISNAAELYWFAGLVNGDPTVCDYDAETNPTGTKQYKSAQAILTANITVNTGVLTETGKLSGTDFTVWTPIGNSSNLYTGTFDGQGHTVSGLYYNDNTNTNDTTNMYVGLFGKIGNYGKVSNVGVVDSYFNGYMYVGGVCGYIYSNYVTIQNCYNTGAVSGSESVGGVCGYNIGTIQNCYNTGAVSGTSIYIGGVCGHNSLGTIQNCYNTGAVNGNERVGGVCGYNFVSSSTTKGSITNCYNTGVVSGSSSSYIGGVSGYNNINDRTNNCYYLKDTATGGINSADVTGSAEVKTTDQFSSGEVAALLQGTQSEAVWGQNIDNDSEIQAYPVLGGAKVYRNSTYKGCIDSPGDPIYEYSNTEAASVYEDHNYTNGFCEFCGKYQPANLNSGVYEISNAGQLYWFAGLVNGDSTVCNYDVDTNPTGTQQNTAACAKLTDSITVNKDVLDESGNLSSNTSGFRSWTPIGNESNRYSGTFDGQGHTVSGLYLSDGYENYVGLFGHNNGTIQNVGVVNSYFKGYMYIGGVSGFNYNGGNDDNGGTITNCYNTGTVIGTSAASYVGGVCGVNNGGTIKNCYNTGTVSGTGNNVGGVCGNNNYNSAITNCYNTGKVSGTKNVGGVSGDNYGTITNCYNTGKVSGTQKVGGVSGEHYGTISNCYYLEGCNADGTTFDCSVGTSKTATQFGSGEVAYLLSQGCTIGSTAYDGSIWGQNIDNSETTQDYPVFSNAKVYKTTPCVSYTNEKSNLEKFHAEYNDNGFCTVCGYYKQATKNDNDYYEIGNAGQLYWFAALVNGTLTDGTAQDKSANAILTADITVNKNVLNPDGTLNTEGSFKNWTPIGNFSSQYAGTFDGNGKTVSGLYFNNADADYVGLFGYIGSDVTVKNIGVVDSYFNGNNNVGGVCGYIYDDGIIENCYSKSYVNGSAYIGGVCGYIYERTKIINCYNTGTVSGTGYCVGGVCGGHSGNGSITNCYNTGSVNGSSNVGGVLGGSSNGVTIENCYYLEGTATDAIGSNTGTLINVASKTTAQFASGEVAYLLNGSTSEGTLVWGQTLTGEGKQAYPVLGGTKVYPCTKGCTAKYSNEQNTTGEHTAPDSYDSNGFGNCTDCGAEVYQPATLNGSTYEISNAGQLYWFADKVNNDNANFGSANAILTKDIVVNENLLSSLQIDESGNITSDTTGFRSWTPIGINESIAYDGTFDGKNYTISGLYFNDTNKDSVGLFGFIHGTVKNVGVVDSYFSGRNYVGGVCANNEGGTITNCYNTGTVSGSSYVGGVCGQNPGGTIQNCYNTGAVSGSISNVGGVCGQNAGGKIQNCYYLAETSDENGGKTTAQFNSGEVAYLLAKGENGSVWGQQIGTDNYPVLGGATVYQTTPCVSYTNDGNATEKAHTDAGDPGDGKCDLCGAKFAYIVSLLTEANEGTPSVANPLGGGKFNTGVTTTITAEAVPGYTFNGWYEGETLKSADLSFEFTVGEEDVTFTAKYTANRTMSVTITSESANFNIAVNNGTSENFTTQQVNSYYVGTVLTLTANGDDFDYWANDIGAVVSRNATFDYTVVGNVSLTAVFNKKADNKATVTFVTAYDQIIGRKQITAADTIDVPVTPVRYGYDFIGWSVNGGEAVSADKVVAEIQTAVTAVLATSDTTDDIVMVRPVYTAKELSIKVTVYNGNSETGTELSYNVNDIVTVTAEAVSGMKFAYWTDGTGKILSYNETYKFYATADTTVKAAYTAEETVIEAMGTTEVVNVVPDSANGKISFVTMSTVPEGCTIQIAGLIATTNAEVANGTFDDITAEYVRGKSWSGNAYRYTWNKGATVGQKWYVKAYLVYTDKNGNTQTVYGNKVVTASLE